MMNTSNVLKNCIATIMICFCLPVDIHAGEEGFERGRQLFEKSGCVNCHTANVQDDLARKGLAYEQPLRSRILTKLRVQAAIAQDRDARFSLSQVNDCQSVRVNFGDEYARIYNTILHGNPVFPMPAWKQRSVDTPSSPEKDGYEYQGIEEIIGYLLVSEGLSLTKDTIARWKSDLPPCINSKETDVATGISSSSQARRDQIYARLEYLDKKKYMFDTLPTIAFMSYQTHLLNQVGYLEDGDLDIWILRQAEGGDINYNTSVLLRENRFPNPLLFLIVVDRKDPQYRSYFFKQPSMEYRFALKNPRKFFIRESVHNPNHLVDADMNDCFSCHSSGPLRLRPRKWDGLLNFTAENWSMIDAFNRRILTYGSVVTEWPTSQPLPSDSELQSVQDAGCQGCHQMGSIRAPLLRYHSKGIVALMNAHEEKSGYFEYGLPNPNILKLFFGNFQTEVPSISRQLLPVMPPLGPMTERENSELFHWLGVGDGMSTKP